MFKIEADIAAGTTALSKVFHNGKAFPPAVLAAAVDSRKELVVLSASGGETNKETWVVSRARSCS